MVNDIAAGQVDTVKNAGKLVGAFTRWVEPGCQCDSEALVKCLQGEGVEHGNPLDFHHDVRHTLKSRCAKDTGCHLKGWREDRPYGKAINHDAHKIKHAVRKMAEEVHHDFQKEMKDQQDNIDHLTKEFLEEAKDRYTAWGCEPKCTERHTREFKRLHGMKHCKCPGAMTVSGDTSIIFH